MKNALLIVTFLTLCIPLGVIFYRLYIHKSRKLINMGKELLSIKLIKSVSEIAIIPSTFSLLAIEKQTTYYYILCSIIYLLLLFFQIYSVFEEYKIENSHKYVLAKNKSNLSLINAAFFIILAVTSVIILSIIRILLA